MEFTNYTPFPALAFESVDQHDQEFHVVVLRATFDIMPNMELKLADDQQPLAFTDEYYGELNKSSIRQESDLSPYKPKCDVIIIGSAYAPGLKPASRFEAGIRITGSVSFGKKLAIYGPRFWEMHDSSWTLTEATPITFLPLQYEFAYGGECRINENDPASKQVKHEYRLTPDQRQQHPDGADLAPIVHTTYEQNPVGMGYTEQWYVNATKPAEAGLVIDEQEQQKEPQVGVIEKMSRFLGITHAPVPAPTREKFIPVKSECKIPAPQIESPEDPIKEFDKQYKPQGVGVITKAWEPRLKLAGTYDENWLKEKWPGLPSDFDFAYWNCAPQDMQVPYLKGDELFELCNLTPQGTLKFQLPGLLTFMMADFEEGEEELIPARIDTVIIEPDTMQASLVWRALIPVSPELLSLEARMIFRENKTDYDKVWEKISIFGNDNFKPGGQNG
jgi:hypothetical protein